MAAVGMLLDPNKLGREAESFQSQLQKRIVGQDEAIREVVEVYQMFRAGLTQARRPIGSFLFLGPTGSGKTRTVEAVAESLVGDAAAVVKVDCGEFQHSHEIAKLIGSPPGYLGHRETHPLLTQEALNQNQTEEVKLSFVLFDEIEKASDALWNLLLGILDKATLTLGDNRRVDFSRTLIFLTSNLGARELENLVRPKLGFAAGQGERRQAGAGDEHEREIARTGIEAARRRFSPEFMNRLDKIIVFGPLGESELRRILAIELEALRARIDRVASSAPIRFTCTEPAQNFVLGEGTDARYGARHLKRAIERLLAQPISNLIASGQLLPGEGLLVDRDPDGGRLLFQKERNRATPCAQAIAGKSMAA